VAVGFRVASTNRFGSRQAQQDPGAALKNQLDSVQAIHLSHSLASQELCPTSVSDAPLSKREFSVAESYQLGNRNLGKLRAVNPYYHRFFASIIHE
jgi:hypothetical protein